MSSHCSTAAILNACLECDLKSAVNMIRLVDSIGTERFWHFYHHELFVMLCDLNANRIAKLIKTFTLAEFVQGRNVGSTAQIHKMLSHLRTKDTSAANELEIWAFHTSPNSYVPYGTSNVYRLQAHTASEYRDLIRKRDEVNQRMVDERTAAAKLRREERARQHERRQVAHRDLNTERQQVIKAIEAIPDAVGRLDVIARHPNRNIRYFPAQFALISVDDLQRIEPAVCELLLMKIGSSKKGDWMRLRKLLKGEYSREETPCSDL